MDKKKKKAQSPQPRWPRALGPPKKALAHDLKQPTCPGLIFLKRQMAGCLPLIIF